MEKLTLHRLLTELKVIDDRISKAISKIPEFPIKRGNSIEPESNSAYSEEEISVKIIGSCVSVTDLIERRFKLKSALVKANSVTKVTICGKEYTIIEAIEMKEIIRDKQFYLNKLKELRNNQNSLFNKVNNKVDTDYERILEFQIKSLTNKGDIQKVREEFYSTFYNQNKVTKIDPINLDKIIDDLSKEIDDFNVEIDASLSEINATTVVEI